MKGFIFWLLVIALYFGVFASFHGRRWEFGRYGLPRALLAEHGQTYRDGTPVDPMSASLLRTGKAEEIILAVWLFAAVVMGLAIRTTIQTAKLRMQLEKNRAALARLTRKERF